MPAPKLSDDSDELYERVVKAAQSSEEGISKYFFQPDIATLADTLAPDKDSLARLVNELTGRALLRTGKAQGALCWSTRPRQAAEQICRLVQDERVVYEYVESSHTNGIWLKNIKVKSQIESGRVDKIIDKLEKGRLVKMVRNIRSPAQKTYMLSHLIPTDDVTGGSFFDAGDLDESLIGEVGNLIIFHVRQASWVEQKMHRRIKREHTPIEVEDEDATAGAEAETAAVSSPESKRTTSGKKRKRNPNDIEDSAPPRKCRTSHSHHHRDTEPVMLQLAFPANTHTYPTATSIHNFITTTDAIRASKAQQLTVAEIQNVIDVLVWDDKLEKVGDGYRTVRGVKFRLPGVEDDDGSDDGFGMGNGLTQAPCGRCPVFELCGTGQVISPEGCGYWQEWLN